MEMDIGLKERKTFSFIAFNLLISIKMISKKDARGCLKEIYFSFGNSGDCILFIFVIEGILASLELIYLGAYKTLNDRLDY